jgi:hypothetical protein
MNIEIEIGNNLRIVMEEVIKRADRAGPTVSVGEELRKAFNLDLSSIISTIGAACSAHEHGQSVVLNIGLPKQS